MSNGNTREFVDYFAPPKKVWIQVLDPQHKTPLRCFGNNGNLTYAGYQPIGAEAFMVFDEVKDSNRKTDIKRFVVNAKHILYMGIIEPKE